MVLQGETTVLFLDFIVRRRLREVEQDVQGFTGTPESLEKVCSPQPPGGSILVYSRQPMKVVPGAGPTLPPLPGVVVFARDVIGQLRDGHRDVMTRCSHKTAGRAVEGHTLAGLSDEEEVDEEPPSALMSNLVS